MQHIASWVFKPNTVFRQQSGVPSEGLIPKGERHDFLMFVAVVCHESAVKPQVILAILKMLNSSCCNPPKPETKLGKIVDWTGRHHYVRCRTPHFGADTAGLNPRGKRHKILASLAWSCRKHYIKQGTILAALRQVNFENCSPPKSNGN